MLAEPTKAALMGHEMGGGKTLMAVEISKALGADVVLVIAPLNTQDGWKATFARQESGLEFRVIKNTKAGKAAYADLAAGKSGAYFIGTQLFALSATAKPGDPETGAGGREKWTSWSAVSKHIDVAVLDESHKASNRKSLMFKVLKTLKPKFKLAMSGTPAGNKFEGLWAPTRWLWPDTRNAAGELYVDSAPWRWATKWAVMEFSPHTSSGKKVGAERNPGAYVNSLPCYLRYEAPKKPVDTLLVQVGLSPAQQAMWDQMSNTAMMWLAEQPVIAEFPIVQKTRLRQIALGEVSLNAAGEIDFADDCASTKIDACEKIIKREVDKSIIFYTSSAKFARVLAKRIGAELWSGQVSPAARDEVKGRFMAGTSKYLVATIASFGTGVDGAQTVCNTEVWCDESFNRIENEQATGRVNRQGQVADRITRYKLLSTLDDEQVMSKLEADALAMRASMRKGDTA